MPINTDDMLEYENAKDSYKHCTTKIRELKGQKKFYVGATGNTEERHAQLETDKKMKTMHVLCKTKTQHQAESLEKKLVKVFGKLKTNADYNEKTKQGQTGGSVDLVKGNNYIYVLFR